MKPLPKRLLAQINALQTMTTEELRDECARLVGKRPGPAARAKFLRRFVAYKLQEAFYGPLSPSAEAALDAAAEKEKPAEPKPVAQDGPRLVREWKGVKHVVTVRDDGSFEYAGRIWGSLSAIARAITGTRWNGPLFFGLKKARA